MPPSPARTYASYDSAFTPALDWVSIDPSPESRLGDWGYISLRGKWVKICNVFDVASCQAINARPILLDRAISQYITKAPGQPLADPFVILSPKAHWETMDSELFAAYLLTLPS